MGTQHNEIHYGSDFVKAIGLAVGLGEEEGVFRLGETWQPIIDPFSRPEWQFLFDEKLCGIQRFNSAVAGEFTWNALVNPGTTKILIVVDQVIVASGVAGLSYDLEISTEAAVTATLGTPIPGAVLDSRWPSLSTQGRNYTGSDAAASAATAFERQGTNVAPDVLKFVTPPLILSPGFAAILVCQTVNSAFNCSFRWRERQLLPRELIG